MSCHKGQGWLIFWRCCWTPGHPQKTVTRMKHEVVGNLSNKPYWFFAASSLNSSFRPISCRNLWPMPVGQSFKAWQCWNILQITRPSVSAQSTNAESWVSKSIVEVFICFGPSDACQNHQKPQCKASSRTNASGNHVLSLAAWAQDFEAPATLRKNPGSAHQVEERPIQHLRVKVKF